MVETNFKAEAKLVLPEKVDSNIGCSVKVLSEGVASLCKLPEKIFDIVTKSGATLFRPLAAYLNGRAAIMEARSFVESQNIRKELSQFQLAINVAQNLAAKQQAGQEVPKEIVDTDTLFAIQNAATETTDKDFLEFWARLYTEEVCNPNTISKKTVELCKVIDRQVAEILEKKIFPYCADGYFFATYEIDVYDLSRIEDYGFIAQRSTEIRPEHPSNNIILSFGQYTVVCRSGFAIAPPMPKFSLSISGAEIRNIIARDNVDVNFDMLKNSLTLASKSWRLSKKFKGNIVTLISDRNVDTNFVIAQGNKIIYPESWQNKSIVDYTNACLETLDIKTS